MEFSYKFPAIRGIQANREFYTTMIPLKIINKIFIYNDDELPAEYRAQRNLNQVRVPEIGDYILNNPNTYVFSSLTASVDGDMEFDSLDGKDIGYLNISLEAKFLINDGQHRRAAIEYALEKNEKLKDEVISVVLFKDTNLERSQQMFADLNRYAINPSKSIGILYDSRDELAILTKNTVDKVELLKYYTDKENTSLAKYSSKAFILSNIYQANRILTNGIKIEEDIVCKFWESLFKIIPEFKLLVDKKINATELRKSFVITYGICLEAIAIIGNEFLKEDKKDFNKLFKNLKNVDWHRENIEWLNVIISPSGRIVKNTKSVKMTSILIKKKLELPINQNEIEFEKEFFNSGK
ncbi:MAG: DNA sulfur modification protein DndB [Fusobacteriaceae bacterium]|nr:DNA sulfur modification protein DndB [Fusobacteriaceae bacterium]